MYLSVDGGTVSPEYVTLTKGQWGEYEVTLTGTGNINISFEQFRGRFFLDEVKVVKPTTTGVVNVQRSAPDVQQYYTLDGRRLNGKPTQKGIYIINGRKVLITPVG